MSGTYEGNEFMISTILNNEGKSTAHLFPWRLQMPIRIIYSEFGRYDENSLSIGKPHNWPDAVVFGPRILRSKTTVDWGFALIHFRDFSAVG